ncbi:MAG: two component histidine kinase, partial [Candidatus Scalindua rubra]
ETDLPMVSVRSNHFEQVFINLFQNAVDAFKDKTEHAEIRVDIFLSKDKESVILKVADNGMGMEQKYVDKIFEPFFTTKEVGKGTGLGLSIVYGIIREHNGTITCESEINKGATFTITLPVSADGQGERKK